MLFNCNRQQCKALTALRLWCLVCPTQNKMFPIYIPVQVCKKKQLSILLLSVLLVRLALLLDSFLSCLLHFTSCFLYKMFISCLPYRLLKKRWLTEEKVELLQLKTTVSLGLFLGLNNFYLLLLFFD